MQQFNINKDSTLPYLEIEPICDGRHTFKKLYDAIQSATVTFTMTNLDTNIKKIANAPAYIVEYDDDSCEDKFVIQYRWNKRDTNEKGRYTAFFKIKFENDFTIGDDFYPSGDLIVPIQEEIIVNVQ
jgi:hypothetical protein